MSYGIQLTNSYGAQALDDQHKSLVVKYSGTTKSQQTLNSAVIANDNPDLLGVCRTYLRSGTFAALPQVDQWKRVGPNNNYGLIYCDIPANGSDADTVFYQISEAKKVSASLEAVFEDPGYPQTGCVGFINRANVPFKVAGPITALDSQGGYGLRTFNEVGDVMFDSNAGFLAIRYAFILSKATMDSLLVTDTPLDVTLPEAMANCWIAAPIYAPYDYSFVTYAGSDILSRRAYIEFWQHDATTIRFQRWSATSLTSSTPTYYAYSHDAIFYVARDS